MKLIFNISLIIISFYSQAQQKDFEGKMEFTTEVKSKLEGISDKVMRKIIGQGERTTSYIKQGNYLISSELSESWYLLKDKKVYSRIRGIDTLYYQDYAADTNIVWKVSRPAEKKKIIGYDCSAILFETKDTKRQYFYAPVLFKNPVYDQDNKIERYDLYSRETSSLWLSQKIETDSYSEYDECTKVTPQTVDDSIYILPDLPIRKLSPSSFIKGPEFAKPGGWVKYITSNINAELAAKYIKLPKGESMASKTVVVTFVITERGDITNIGIENKGDAHKKLEEEAVRIISESPKWKPATIMGEKIPDAMRQPIVFAVTR